MLHPTPTAPKPPEPTISHSPNEPKSRAATAPTIAPNPLATLPKPPETAFSNSPNEPKSAPEPTPKIVPIPEPEADSEHLQALQAAVLKLTAARKQRDADADKKPLAPTSPNEPANDLLLSQSWEEWETRFIASQQPEKPQNRKSPAPTAV